MDKKKVPSEIEGYRMYLIGIEERGESITHELIVRLKIIGDTLGEIEKHLRR